MSTLVLDPCWTWTATAPSTVVGCDAHILERGNDPQEEKSSSLGFFSSAQQYCSEPLRHPAAAASRLEFEHDLLELLSAMSVC